MVAPDEDEVWSDYDLVRIDDHHISFDDDVVGSDYDKITPDLNLVCGDREVVSDWWSTIMMRIVTAHVYLLSWLV